MKQFTSTKRFFFSLLLLAGFAFVVSSCESQLETVEAESVPEVQAVLGGYGSCGSCPLPSNISGTLPAQLYPGSVWMSNLENCFQESLSEFGTNCKYKTTGTNTMTTSIPVYLQFSTSSTNTVAGFCSYFYQVGNALGYARPTGNWLLSSINYMSHTQGSNYIINVTWKSYICQYTLPVRR